MAQAEVGAQLEERARRDRGVRYYVRRFARDKRAVVGAVILSAFILSAVFGSDLGPIPGFAPYDAQAQAFELLEPPTWAHPLGTDNIGRDLLSRLIVGSRTSMIVGVLGLTLAALVGLPLGVLGGYFGGWIDMLTQRYIDIQWAFPNFIIAVMLVGIFGLGLQNVIMAIFLAYIDDFARVIRAMVLAIKEEDYILAARAQGVSDWRIMYRHVFPNAMPPVIVVASVFFSSAILIEAGLTFLGLGVSPLTPTWGTVLNDARPFFSRAWWLATYPGLVIMLVVLSVNFVGDAIRDLNDVHEYDPSVTGA
ncbi:MAG: ABC transporter permease [Chloroflexi bacterium]|nr:ABC transporter permease [Chloroflexota bacterium]